MSEQELPEPEADPGSMLESEPDLTRPARIATWLVVVFALIIAAAYLVGNVVAVIAIIAYEMVTNPAFDIDGWTAVAENDGFVLAMCTFGGVVLSVPVSFLLACCQNEMSGREYLALRKVSVQDCLLWVGISLGLILASDCVTYLLGRAMVPKFVLQVYTSPGALPWLWIALIVGAPLGEELLFRGFLFTGLRTSRLGTIGTAIATSLVWASMHVQYGLYEIGVIFVGGLVLSYVRVRTGSIVPCLLIHAMANLVATIEVAIVTA